MPTITPSHGVWHKTHPPSNLTYVPRPISVYLNWNLFQVYDIPDALNPLVTTDASVFLNGTMSIVSTVQPNGRLSDNRTRAAFHAPTSKDWAMNFNYVFGNPDGNSEFVGWRYINILITS